MTDLEFLDRAEALLRALEQQCDRINDDTEADIDKAMRFARDVDAGLVWINTYRTAAFTSPTGGFKSSGYGKHNGFEVIREYTRVKNVMIDFSGVTHDPFVMRVK